MMEIDSTSSRANSIMMMEVNSRVNEKRPLEISSPAKEAARKHPDINNVSNTTLFINHGEFFFLLV